MKIAIALAFYIVFALMLARGLGRMASDETNNGESK